MQVEKKSVRKMKRFAAKLKSSKGIIFSDLPGPCIVLCNVGQATGFEKKDLIQVIKENISDMPLPKLILQKGESYSFLQFDSIENSIAFYKSCNGKSTPGECAIPIYMNYVDQVPNTDIVYHDENPQGLTLLNNFITKAEEDKLLEIFDWTTEDESNSLKNRQVRHYGYEFRYGTNDVDVNDPLDEKIPPECDFLWRRLRTAGLEVDEPDQLTVNKYRPGQGIPSHVDTHSPFGEAIVSLSLGAAVVMDWRHRSGKFVPLVVPRRSLLVMQGEARYDWQHGIAARSWDPVVERRGDALVLAGEARARGTRLSLTFRRTRAGRCACAYAALCDGAARADSPAARLEELHVHQVYEQIAPHFSQTRHTVWPRVRAFAERVPAGAVLLDLGCGNGKNLLPRADVLQLAGERSAALLRECARPAAGGRVRLDLLHAPLRDACADAVLCVAVLHHFSTEARRVQALRTVRRVLRAGGRALLTVWARDQRRAAYVSRAPSAPAPAPVAAPAHGELPLHAGLPVHASRTPFEHADVLVPWRRRAARGGGLAAHADTTLLRYYHVFEEGELDALCARAGLAVLDSYYEEGNWCVECTAKYTTENTLYCLFISNTCFYKINKTND